MGMIFPGSSSSTPVLIDGTGLQGLAPFSPVVGTAAVGVGTVYTVPAGYKAIIASIELFNASGGLANVLVYLTAGGTDYPVDGAALNDLDSLRDTMPRCLPPGYIIKTSSDAANVTYVVQVAEFTYP